MRVKLGWLRNSVGQTSELKPRLELGWPPLSSGAGNPSRTGLPRAFPPELETFPFYQPRRFNLHIFPRASQPLLTGRIVATAWQGLRRACTPRYRKEWENVTALETEPRGRKV